MTRSPYPDVVNYRDIKAPVHVVFTNRRISIAEISPDEYPGTVVVSGDAYFAPRFFGNRYFGSRYFG